MHVHAQVPIMLRSSYCSLAEHSDKELTDLGECPFDQVPPCSPGAFPAWMAFCALNSAC